MRNRIAIFRPDSNYIDTNYYNSQEVGLAKALAQNGFDIDIFMSGRSKTITEKNIVFESYGTVNVYELPFILIPEIDHAIYPDLINILRKNNYKLIQVNESNELSCYWVSRYASKNNIPCIVYQGMYHPITGRLRSLFQRVFNKTLLPNFIKYTTIAVGKTTSAENYLKRLGFKHTTVLPVGIDTNAFDHSCEKNWRNDYDIPTNHKILLYVGVFEKRRNINFLLDIARRLESHKYTLLLAGDGDEFNLIKNKVQNENYVNVRILGKVAQKFLRSLYEISDFFLLASNYEIYGMVVLEALYFGCPVISTKTAGPNDMIINDFNGYLIHDLNVNKWVDTIKDHSTKLNRKSIRTYVIENLTWNIIAKKYIEMFINDA